MRTITKTAAVLGLFIAMVSGASADEFRVDPINPRQTYKFYTMVGDAITIEFHEPIQRVIAGDLSRFQVGVLPESPNFLWIKPEVKGAEMNLTVITANERLVARVYEVTDDEEMHDRLTSFWMVPRRASNPVVHPSVFEREAVLEERAEEIAQERLDDQVEAAVDGRMRECVGSQFETKAKAFSGVKKRGIKIVCSQVVGDAFYVRYQLEKADVPDQTFTLGREDGNAFPLLAQDVAKRDVHGMVVLEHWLKFDISQDVPDSDEDYVFAAVASSDGEILYQIKMERQS